MMKKIILISSVILVLFIASYFTFIKKNNDEFAFRYEKVSKGDITVFVTATGTLSAVTTVEVGTQVSGRISKLYADFNSIVKEGQLIAQIDPIFLEQSVRDTEASLERAKAQYNENKRNYDRLKILYEKKLEAQVAFDAALTNFESSKATLKQAEAQLERAKINLQYASIIAPINGVVIDRKVNVGQTVAASLSSPILFAIANDLSKMQVQATVDESDIGKISIGQESFFTVDAYSDERFFGKIAQIRLAPIVQQNVVNYTVIIEVSNTELKLMPGMTANVKILIAQKENILKIPNIALRFQPPQELIDTLKLKEIREQFMSRFREGNDFFSKNENRTNEKKSQNQNSQKKKNEKSESKNQNMNQRFSEGNRQDFSFDREKFKKIRDSIQAAHGGNLSREDMMIEFQKVMKKYNLQMPWGQRREQSSFQQPIENTSTKKETSSQENKFEVVQSFPQYQKSTYSTANQTGRGRIWIMNAQGKLEPIFIRTGLNDGKSTEIISDKILEGQQIVINVSNNNQTTAPTVNPLTGQGQGGQFLERRMR